MNVSVKNLRGDHFDIEVQPTDTVLNVKRQIEQILGAQTYPSERQLLIYMGKLLKDETTIEENKVSENAFLVVMLSQMARRDHILTLPVQEPSTIEFSSSDLKWFKGKGWCQDVDNVTLIPFSRVEHFVKGECSSAECPTRFRGEASGKKAEGSSHKPRVDGSLYKSLGSGL